MSWKGFKKAVTRLPQQVLQKAGYAEETYDEEFEVLDGEFKELEHSSKHLSEESRAYLTAVKSLMTAQQQFGQAFVAMMKMNEEEPRSQFEAAADGYVAATNTWVETMGPYVDQTLQSIVLDPSSALVTITKQAHGSIEKRGRKVVDYDRTRNNLKKIKEKVDGGSTADVNKLTKAEMEFAEMKKEYDSLNERLKYELPLLMKMRIEFMDPMLEALISFQIYFFEQGAASLNSLNQYIDFTTPIEDTYTQRVAPAIEFMKTLSLVIPLKIDANADPSSRAEYQYAGKTSMDTPPGYTDAPVAPVVASMASTSISNQNNASDHILAVSLFPFCSETQGDLTFEKDEKIHIIQKSDNQDDWWFGRIGDREGYFPANYVRIV